MNSDNLNKWLTLAANVGVIVGLIVVILELQQTQIIMSAESSMQRAQMSRENASLAAQNDITGIESKLANGETLTHEEFLRAEEFIHSLLRHYEVMHYQNQIGVLDEEIWVNNADGMRGVMNGPLFKYIFPDWPNSGLALRLRKSFIDFSIQNIQ